MTSTVVISDILNEDDFFLLLLVSFVTLISMRGIPDQTCFEMSTVWVMNRSLVASWYLYAFGFFGNFKHEII